MKLSKYNDSQSIEKCCDEIKISDKVKENGDVDRRVLVIENCDGQKVELFKSTLIICLKNVANCKPVFEDYRKPEINSCPYIEIIGQENCCNKAGELTSIVITATSLAALIQLHKNIQTMACNDGCLLHREIFDPIAGSRLDTSYVLPADTKKVHLYKNGQKLVEQAGVGYTISGGGFDLVNPAQSSDIFELIVFA